MAVPNTSTFSFNDVKSNVTGSPDDLVQAFANATPALFDPAYSGAKDSLLNFRNYGAAEPNILTVSPTVIDDLNGDAGVWNFIITSNTSWSATKVAGGSWLGDPSPSSGSGDDIVGMIRSANTTSSVRSGTLQVSTTSGSPIITRFVSITQHPRD